MARFFMLLTSSRLELASSSQVANIAQRERYEMATNEEQTRLWNGPSGAVWVEAQELLDGMFRALEKLLADAVGASGARRVLDVGCGTGATTLAIARRLGAQGECVGLDLSQPMIELARARAARGKFAADFVVGDAQTQALAGAPFDMLVSRFGVMFFADPVAAFANLRRAMRPGGALRCVVFRSPAENPFMTAAERAAAPLLPGLPPRDPDAPGQFAFADARRVQGILESAGWRGVEILPLDVTCTFPARELDAYLMRLGPVGIALRSADEITRERVVTAVRAGFAPYLHGDEVRFTAACWEVAARA
jgi:SAM-dependent methyltransferase